MWCPNSLSKLIMENHATFIPGIRYKNVSGLWNANGVQHYMGVHVCQGGVKIKEKSTVNF